MTLKPLWVAEAIPGSTESQKLIANHTPGNQGYKSFIKKGSGQWLTPYAPVKDLFYLGPLLQIYSESSPSRILVDYASWGHLAEVSGMNYGPETPAGLKAATDTIISFAHYLF